MRPLTISTALVAGCLIAGAAWAQGSSGGSSSSSGSAGGSSSSAAPSSGSSSSGTAAQPGTSTIRPPGSPPGSEGSTGGTAASANRSSTDPDATGGVAGVNRLQPGERSAVAPTEREEELFRKGEELEQKAREGVCSTC